MACLFGGPYFSKEELQYGVVRHAISARGLSSTRVNAMLGFSQGSITPAFGIALAKPRLIYVRHDLYEEFLGSRIFTAPKFDPVLSVDNADCKGRINNFCSDSPHCHKPYD
jgi:hypothetical protein